MTQSNKKLLPLLSHSPRFLLPVSLGPLFLQLPVPETLLIYHCLYVDGSLPLSAYLSSQGADRHRHEGPKTKLCDGTSRFYNEGSKKGPCIQQIVLLSKFCFRYRICVPATLLVALQAFHLAYYLSMGNQHFFFLIVCFYQLLRVQHSCSSTQSWGSVLPSIVETRDQNSRGCPLLFSNRNLGSFCA